MRKTVGAPGVAGRRFQDVSKNGDELPAHAAGQELCLRAADRP